MDGEIRREEFVSIRGCEERAIREVSMRRVTNAVAEYLKKAELPMGPRHKLQAALDQHGRHEPLAQP